MLALRVAEKLHRIANNIEIEWDGMEEVATYVDIPLKDVLNNIADSIELEVEEDRRRLEDEYEEMGDPYDGTVPMF